MSRGVDVLARVEAVWGRESPEYAAVAELVEAAYAVSGDSPYFELEEPEYEKNPSVAGRSRNGVQRRHWRLRAALAAFEVSK